MSALLDGVDRVVSGIIGSDTLWDGDAFFGWQYWQRRSCSVKIAADRPECVCAWEPQWAHSLEEGRTLI
jgi:hypothetical protein